MQFTKHLGSSKFITTFVKHFPFHLKTWASEVAQRVDKALAAKPNELSLIPWASMREGEKSPDKSWKSRCNYYLVK